MSENGDTTFETVSIQGEEYKVPQAVVAEIERLREEPVIEIKNWKPEPGHTIVVVSSPDASREFIQQIGQTAAGQFPNTNIAVMPRDLELHTVKGLAALLAAGDEMVQCIMGSKEGDPLARAAAVAEWHRLIGEQDG